MENKEGVSGSPFRVGRRCGKLPMRGLLNNHAVDLS